MKWFNPKFLIKKLIIIVLFTNPYLSAINNKTFANNQNIKKWKDTNNLNLRQEIESSTAFFLVNIEHNSVNFDQKQSYSINNKILSKIQDLELQIKKESNSHLNFKNSFKQRYVNDNFKNNTCAHEAGHTLIIIFSKFKDNFIKMEFSLNNIKFSGKTEYKFDFDYAKQIMNISNNDLFTLLWIDLGGFAAEDIFLKANFFQYMINEVWIMNSSDLDDYHNIYQTEFEVRNLKTSNESSLSFIKKQFNKTKIIINNNKLEWNKIIETCLLINYVNKNHTDYILKHKEVPIPLFTLQQIKTLTIEQIATLTPEQIKTLTSEQIQTLTPKQIQVLTAKQIQTLLECQILKLTIEQIQTLTKKQIQTLTPQQISWLTAEQIKSLTTAQIQTLTIQQIIWLIPAQIQALTPAQIQTFWSWQISWLTPPQIQALTDEQIKSLTAKQISALTKKEQIKSLTPAQLSQFMVEQIPYFTKEQMSFFTEKQIKVLTPAQIQAFWPWQISELTTQQIQTLTDEQIKSLTAKQISALTKKEKFKNEVNLLASNYNNLENQTLRFTNKTNSQKL